MIVRIEGVYSTISEITSQRMQLFNAQLLVQELES
jgi:hypothetical protein